MKRFISPRGRGGMVVLGVFLVISTAFVSGSKYHRRHHHQAQAHQRHDDSFNGFFDSDQDLLAMPSDQAPVSDRRGPITQYAFDNVPLESKDGPAVSVVAPPVPATGLPNVVPPPSEQGQMFAQASSQPQHPIPIQSRRHQRQHQHHQPQPQQSQAQEQQQPQEQLTIPVVQGPSGPGIIDSGFAISTYPVEGVLGEAVPIPVPIPPVVAVGSPTTVYVTDEQNAVALGSGYGYEELGFIDIVHDVMANPTHAVHYMKYFITNFHIPKDHYLNVISFTGIYLFLSYLFFGHEDVLQLTCEVTGGNKKSVLKEYHYHAGRRFVPALPVDQKLQKKFLKLFKGLHLEEDGGSSSSEEINQINDLLPKGQFFYSLSPVAIEAWTQLQRLFVALKSPEEVYSLAKDLLYNQKINPKIWYLGLIAAAQERPDMTGFTLAFPLDAMPDWFIPAHLIKDEFDRYRSLTLTRQGRKDRVRREAAIEYLTGGRNTTFARALKSKLALKKKSAKAGELIISLGNETSTTTTERPIPDSAELSTEFIGLDGSIQNENRGEEVDEAQLQETMLRHGGVGRQNRNKRDKNKGKDKGKVHGDKDKKYKGKHKGKGKHKDKKGEECIVVDGRVGHDNGIENKLWYWREDIQLNQHHWYWHQVYPLNFTRYPDRKGELFFFMHRNFIQRYNAERLSLGLHRSYPMDFPGGIVHEGYNSHLADLSSGKWWAPRPPKQPLIDILHVDDPVFARNILIPDLFQQQKQLVKAIKLGKMMTPVGKYVKIANSQGIDPLANTIEASQTSVNPLLYDFFGIHNSGHLMISFLADPLYKLGIPPGPMAEQAMSMRDPAFYPYHVWLDNLFEKHKSLLAPYKPIGGEFPLLWRGVEIHHVEVISKGHAGINELRTFWTDRKFELSPGVDRSVDIAEEDEAKVCAVHMAHEPFLFKIVVDRKPCARSKTGKATIRIFMAPRYDEKGRRFHFAEQRRLMFQLDAFQVKLRVGKNIITRRSHDSSLTKPWSRSLNEMIHGQQSNAAEFSGCGLPQHLYIPRGNEHGMPFDLFVMATNYDEDKVVDNPKDLQFPEPVNQPYIFCGLPRRAYPDARPMGYPFDRPANLPPIPCKHGHSFGSMVCRAFNLIVLKEVETLEQFTRKASNMKSTVISIKHIDHFYPSHHHDYQEDEGEEGQGGDQEGGDGDEGDNGSSE